MSEAAWGGIEDVLFYETHAHYDDSAFDEDREQILWEVHSSGVSFVLNPGCDIPGTERAAALAQQFSFVYFAAGIHPEELDNLPEDYREKLRLLACRDKCLAIGEIGLDYYWDSSRKELQKTVFEEQLKIALEMDLPVIIHDREAHGDCFEIVRRYPALRGVFHCYSGSAEMAAELLKRGWYLGFDGPVTYKNAKKTIEVLESIPLDRILIETDSPYMSPVPMRGKRNDSRNLLYIAKKIAEIRQLSLEDVARITAQNAKTLFRM